MHPTPPLQILRPFSGVVEDSEDFDPVAFYAVGYNERGVAHYEFAGSVDASSPPHSRVVLEVRNSIDDAKDDSYGGAGIVLGDVGFYLGQISARLGEPSNLQV